MRHDVSARGTCTRCILPRAWPLTICSLITLPSSSTVRIFCKKGSQGNRSAAQLRPTTSLHAVLHPAPLSAILTKSTPIVLM